MPSRSIIRTGVGPHREPGNRFPAMAAAINLLAARAARVQSRRNLSRSLSPKLDHSHSITRFDRSRTGPYVLEAVSGAVRQAFGRGLTDPMVIGDIRTDLGRTLANPELSGGSTLSDAAKRDQERHAIGRQDAHRTFPDTPQSSIAPLKECVKQLAAERARLCAENARLRAEIAALQAKPKAVGRNDPCPCGSGKKFKKCCLH